jgi:hypothetical protein
MRSIAKQNAIRGARLKFIKIAMFQDKPLATKRPKMRDDDLCLKRSSKRVKFKIEHRKIRLEIYAALISST